MDYGPIHEKCLRCGRKLKTLDSKKLGFGKTCWEKYQSEDNHLKLFVTEDVKNEKTVSSGTNL